MLKLTWCLVLARLSKNILLQTVAHLLVDGLSGAIYPNGQFMTTGQLLIIYFWLHKVVCAAGTVLLGFSMPKYHGLGIQKYDLR